MKKFLIIISFLFPLVVFASGQNINFGSAGGADQQIMDGGANDNAYAQSFTLLKDSSAVAITFGLKKPPLANFTGKNFVYSLMQSDPVKPAPIQDGQIATQTVIPPTLTGICSTPQTITFSNLTLRADVPYWITFTTDSATDPINYPYVCAQSLPAVQNWANATLDGATNLWSTNSVINTYASLTSTDSATSTSNGSSTNSLILIHRSNPMDAIIILIGLGVLLTILKIWRKPQQH